MKSFTTTILSFLALSLTLAAGEEVLFFDDFSGDSLDRSKWNVEVSGPLYNQEQQAYVDSVKTLYLAKGETAQGAKNGALVLHPRFAPKTKTTHGKTYDFISARLNSKHKAEFLYGIISARIRMSKGAGLWTAFWMLGNGAWPSTGEIDIMENVGEADWAGVALHGTKYNGDTPLFNKFFYNNPVQDIDT